jgi:hypothetical protein
VCTASVYANWLAVYAAWFNIDNIGAAAAL